MFKKLRQKLENDETTSSPGKDTRRDDRKLNSSLSAAQHRKSSSNLIRSDSLASLTSSEPEMPTESSSREEISSMLIHRTTQVKRLEVKLAEYGQTLKERSRECEKLSVALEKQQDSALRKLGELNDTYAKDRKRSEATITKLETEENKLTATVEELKEENEKLKKSVDEWEKEKDVFERMKSEFFEKRDNSEELHDLQNQELAKLKHLLLKSEKEAKELQISRDSHLADLIQSRDRNDELESLLRESTTTIHTAEASLKQVTAEKESLNTCKSANEATIKSLSMDNSSLREKLSCLALDLQKTRSSLSSLENTYSSLIEKYEALKHNNETILAQMKTENAERESLINHLEDKLKSMEQRENTDKLPEDERLQVLHADRIQLENKLEESRQQLVNIKSTWSDKINSLEKQVSNLSSKIVEDREEIMQKDKELEDLKMELKEKVDAFTLELTSRQQINEDLTSHNNNILMQISELEAKLIEMETIHELQLSKSKQHVTELQDTSSEREKKLRCEIERIISERELATNMLQQVKDENKELKSDHKIQVDQLEQEISMLNRDMATKVEEVMSKERLNCEMLKSMEELRSNRDDWKQRLETNLEEIADSAKKLQQSDEHASQIEKELATMGEKLERTEEEMSVVTSKLSDASCLLVERDNELDRCRETFEAKAGEVVNLTQTVKDLEATIESRASEMLECKKEIACLKNNESVEGEEVEMMRADNARLHERLVERERSLKLTQQRLHDVKKSLQKELAKQGEGGQDRRRSSSSKRPPRDHSAPAHPANPHNGVSPDEDPLPSFLAGKVSLDDPSLSEDQRDVVVKYLKHVVLRFLSCGQSEAQPLIKAISAVLHFTSEEEKLVREVMEYRSSWFSVRPSAKNIIKPSLRGKNSSRHTRR